MPPDARPLHPEIDASLTRRLLVAAPSAELAHVVLALIVAAYLSNEISWLYGLAWAAAVGVVVLVGIPWRRRALRQDVAPAAVYRGLRIRVGLDAALWGLGAAWLVGHADLVHTAMVLIVLAGLVAGGLVTLMADPVAFRILQALVLGPPAVALLATGTDRNHLAIGTLIVVFAFFENLVHGRSFTQLIAHEEAKLRIIEQDERLRALEGATTEGIVLHENGRVVDVNDAFLRLSGYPDRGEVVGRSVLDFCAPQSRALIEQAVRSGTETTYEAEGLRKDGSTLIAELTGRSAHYRGRAVRMVAIRDISARKRLEAQLKQSQRMEAIGQLAGAVAHDFNNLLTTILATGDLLRSTLPADAASRDDLATIVKAAQRGADLTRRLLAFSRKQPIEMRSLSLAALVMDFQSIARRVVPVDVDVVVETDTGDSAIEADPGAITQILMNLVSNARDAMPLGGRIHIAVGRGVLTEEHVHRRGWGTAGDYVVVTVSDTGAGMDAETQRRIFDPFFTTKPVAEGAGLGMSMVYGLIKQHGGFIEIESEAGRGTRVRLYFPGTTRPVTDTGVASTAAPAGGNERILLVEDDEGVRTAAARALQRYGYTVAVAVDGTAALAALQGGAAPPDLIIANVVMPGLSGPDLLSHLRELGPVPPVLFTSSYADRNMAELAPFGTTFPFLAKPWSITDLLRKAREVLDARWRSL